MTGSRELSAAVLARVVERVTVNRVMHREHRWFKRRKWIAPLLVLPGNLWMGLARAGFRMHAWSREWAPYEIARHRAMHGATSAGLSPEGIWTAHIPGAPLTALLGSEHAAAAMRAAGREVARAHRTEVDGEAFSHGDMHLSNLLYDATTQECRLLDFETPHLPTMAARDRHADDLATLTLDLIAKARGPDGFDRHLSRFVEGYREEKSEPEAVLRLAASRLHLARGVFPRSLQLVRTRRLAAHSLFPALARARAAMGVME